MVEASKADELARRREYEIRTASEKWPHLDTDKQFLLRLLDAERLRNKAARRFWTKVDFTLACWLWTSAIGTNGYGKFWNGEIEVPAHRWSYEAEVGPIPDGLFIDHLCRVKTCVKPDHLEPVTNAENVKRGFDLACRNGHGRTAENTLIKSDGTRYCLTCRDRYTAKKRLRRELARASVA